jgi:hypothetical protein
MRIGRFMTIDTELITVLETHPETFQTIINQTIQQYGLTLCCIQRKYEVGVQREVDHVYQNDSLWVKIVAIDVICHVEHDGSSFWQWAQLKGWVDLYNSPSDEDPPFSSVGSERVMLEGLSSGNQAICIHGTLILFVPPGAYYMVKEDATDDGSFTYGVWSETDLGAVA